MNKKFITILILGSSLLVNAAKGPADFFDMMITNWRKEANAQKKKDLGVAVEEVFYTLSSDDKDERKGDIAELKGIAESAVVMVRPATGTGAGVDIDALAAKIGVMDKAFKDKLAACKDDKVCKGKLLYELFNSKDLAGNQAVEAIKAALTKEEIDNLRGDLIAWFNANLKKS